MKNVNVIAVVLFIIAMYYLVPSVYKEQMSRYMIAAQSNFKRGDLVQHKVSKEVGFIEKVEVTFDKRVRAEVKFYDFSSPQEQRERIKGSGWMAFGFGSFNLNSDSNKSYFRIEQCYIEELVKIY